MERGPKLLIAEDDLVTRRIMEATFRNHAALQPLAIEAVFASDGEEALTRFHAEHPDVVIADLLMPRLDGFALCRSIRQSEAGRRIPIIVTSAIWKQPAVLDKLRREFDVDFVGKPFKIDELVDAVLQAIGQLRPPSP